MVDQIEKNEITGTCRPYGERRRAYRVLVRKAEGKRSIGNPRCRMDDNIKMDLQEVKWNYVVD